MKNIIFAICGVLFFVSCQRNQQEEQKSLYSSTTAPLEVQIFDEQGENITKKHHWKIRITEVDNKEVSRRIDADRIHFEIHEPVDYQVFYDNKSVYYAKGKKKNILYLDKQKKEFFTTISHLEEYAVMPDFSAGGFPVPYVNQLEIDEKIFPKSITDRADAYYKVVLKFVYKNGEFLLKE